MVGARSSSAPAPAPAPFPPFVNALIFIRSPPPETARRRCRFWSSCRALVRYRDLPDRSRSFVVFVSHAWMRPHTTPSFAHPDTSSRGGEKYRLISEAGDRIRAHLPPDVRVLLWIDYSCVDQVRGCRWGSAVERKLIDECVHVHAHPCIGAWSLSDG